MQSKLKSSYQSVPDGTLIIIKQGSIENIVGRIVDEDNGYFINLALDLFCFMDEGYGEGYVKAGLYQKFRLSHLRAIAFGRGFPEKFIRFDYDLCDITSTFG